MATPLHLAKLILESLASPSTNEFVREEAFTKFKKILLQLPSDFVLSDLYEDLLTPTKKAEFETIRAYIQKYRDFGHKVNDLITINKQQEQRIAELEDRLNRRALPAIIAPITPPSPAAKPAPETTPIPTRKPYTRTAPYTYVIYQPEHKLWMAKKFNERPGDPLGHIRVSWCRMIANEFQREFGTQRTIKSIQKHMNVLLQKAKKDTRK